VCARVCAWVMCLLTPPEEWIRRELLTENTDPVRCHRPSEAPLMGPRGRSVSPHPLPLPLSASLSTASLSVSSAPGTLLLLHFYFT